MGPPCVTVLRQTHAQRATGERGRENKGVTLSVPQDTSDLLLIRLASFLEGLQMQVPKLWKASFKAGRHVGLSS